MIIVSPLSNLKIYRLSTSNSDKDSERQLYFHETESFLEPWCSDCGPWVGSAGIASGLAGSVAPRLPLRC